MVPSAAFTSQRVLDRLDREALDIGPDVKVVSRDRNRLMGGQTGSGRCDNPCPEARDDKSGHCGECCGLTHEVLLFSNDTAIDAEDGVPPIRRWPTVVRPRQRSRARKTEPPDRGRKLRTGRRP